MKIRASRRPAGIALLAATALAATALTGCGEKQDRRPLTVVGWGGSSQAADHEALIAPFAKASGLHVQEDSWHGGIGVIRTKVLGGDTSWDVVQAETEEIILGCEEGLFEPLDWASLGGRAAYSDAAVNNCGVGSQLWSYLLGYDGDAIKGAGPRSWVDFWDVKRFAGKRGMRKTPKYTLEIALLADGVPAAQIYTVLRTPGGVDRAFRKLDQLKPNIVWWSSIAQVPDLLGSREVVMSVTSPGRLIIANRDEHRNFKLQWAGNIYAVDYWAILKNSPRKAEAAQFIQYVTRPENQMRLARIMPTGLTSKAAQQAIEPRYRENTATDPANMAGALKLDGDFWVEYGDELTQRFNAWVAH
ncbi:MAG: polyamine ABC transporter substrate-binding protein [Pseudomonadota bacterium]